MNALKKPLILIFAASMLALANYPSFAQESFKLSDYKTPITPTAHLILTLISMEATLFSEKISTTTCSIQEQTQDSVQCLTLPTMQRKTQQAIRGIKWAA